LKDKNGCVSCDKDDYTYEIWELNNRCTTHNNYYWKECRYRGKRKDER